jgi:hypothetical protein
MKILARAIFPFLQTLPTLRYVNSLFNRGLNRFSLVPKSTLFFVVKVVFLAVFIGMRFYFLDLFVSEGQRRELCVCGQHVCYFFGKLLLYFELQQKGLLYIHYPLKFVN